MRNELTTELARLDAAVSTRLATAGYTAPTTPPTAAQVASATRTELTTELARIDAAVSTRSTLTAGAAMTLAPAYDAAKTAATQTSVDALATANQTENDATQAEVAAVKKLAALIPSLL